MQNLNLKIDGMVCEACVGHVSKALQNAPGVARVVVDLKAQSARVEGDNLEESKLVAVVEEEGYEARAM